MKNPFFLIGLVALQAFSVQALAKNGHRNTLGRGVSSQATQPPAAVQMPAPSQGQVQTGAEENRQVASLSPSGEAETRASGNMKEKGGSAATFGGERPIFNDPRATEVGPKACFTTVDGQKVDAYQIATGVIPAGTQLIWITPRGSQEVTVEAQGATSNIANQSNNYKYQDVSLSQIRGGAPMNLVFGIRPTVSTGLSFAGVERVEDMDYYAATQGMRDAMTQGGLTAGPDVYLILAKAPNSGIDGGENFRRTNGLASAAAAANIASDTAAGSSSTGSGSEADNASVSLNAGTDDGCGNVIGGGGGGGQGGQGGNGATVPAQRL
jgi:hypothetical protein